MKKKNNIVGKKKNNRPLKQGKANKIQFMQTSVKFVSFSVNTRSFLRTFGILVYNLLVIFSFLSG